jgi:hypothetical protein
VGGAAQLALAVVPAELVLTVRMRCWRFRRPREPERFVFDTTRQSLSSFLCNLIFFSRYGYVSPKSPRVLPHRALGDAWSGPFHFPSSLPKELAQPSLYPSRKGRSRLVNLKDPRLIFRCPPLSFFFFTPLEQAALPSLHALSKPRDRAVERA